MSIDQAIALIENFQGGSLTESLAIFESEIVGSNSITSQAFCDEREIDMALLSSASAIKKVSSQIDVVIHAAGILNSLPALLEDGELVESVSLGAGNTGKKFDLETNLRVAEFKFIDWKGGPESIRQNGIFKDFYELAEYETQKKKILYVVGTTYPLKFFNGGRAISSVLSKQPEMLKSTREKYGDQVAIVRDYYELHKDKVSVCDVWQYIGRV